MKDLIRLLAICAIAGGLILAGCSGEAESSGGGDHDGHDHDHGAEGHDDHDEDDHDHDHDDHDHAKGDHDDHDHDHAEDDHDEHDHGSEKDLGTVEIGGTSLKVSVSGELKAGAEMHLDIEHAGGPEPSTLRLWIGEKSGVGSMKIKAEGDGEHYHSHVEAPAKIDEHTALWIEVKSEGGKKATGSVPLSK